MILLRVKKQMKLKLMEVNKKTTIHDSSNLNNRDLQMWKEGDIIGDRFTVCGIREGGFATVYLCYDPKQRFATAVKVLKKELLDRHEICEGFRNEALTWVNLGSHQNIVQAYYVMAIDHVFHIFLEFVPGLPYLEPTLSDWIHKRGLTLIESLRIAIQICQGMLHARKEMAKLGIEFVHQDLKPSNILISSSGEAKVSDFGLVRHMIPSDTMTLRGPEGRAMPLVGEDQRGGTPLYMAPEQFHSDSRIDARTDIYSFGCVLYEMITGEFAKGNPDPMSIVAFHRENREPASSRLLDYAPKELADAVALCLGNSPNVRPTDFEEVRELLNAARFGIPGYRTQEGTIANNPTLNDMLLKGISLLHLGRFVDSIKCFNEIVSEKADFSVAWYYKAMCEYQGMVLDQACTSAENALRLGLPDTHMRKSAEQILNVGAEFFSRSVSRDSDDIINDLAGLLPDD